MNNRIKYVFVTILAVVFLYPKGYFVLSEKENNNIDFSKINVEPDESKDIGIYLINLDHSKARYNYVKPQIEKLGMPFQRISAVNGEALPESEFSKVVDFKKYKDFIGNFPKKGTIGCSLSHIEAWKKFLASNHKYALIFEDDISFDPTELLNVLNFLTNNDSLWDINSLEISHRGTPLAIKSDNNKHNLCIYLTEVSHAGAYLINRKAVVQLLMTALPIKMPIDHYFTRSWEMGLKFTGIEPRVVFQRFGDSEIGMSSLQYRLEQSTSITVYFNKALYKFQSYIARIVYNFKIYIESKTKLFVN